MGPPTAQPNDRKKVAVSAEEVPRAVVSSLLSVVCTRQHRTSGLRPSARAQAVTLDQLDQVGAVHLRLASGLGHVATRGSQQLSHVA